MRIPLRTFPLTFVMAASVLTIAGCNRGQKDSVEVVEDKPDEAVSEIPKPSKTGPYPKAVVDSKVYRFGIMEEGEEAAHKFVVRNEGQAPLRLYANPSETTCQCTVGRLKKSVLEPGESTEVEVSWHIRVRGPLFSHSALVRTNDPDNDQFRLRVVGWISQVLAMKPSDEWHMGVVRDEETPEVKGVISSDVVDDFKIVEFKSSSPLFSAEWRKLNAEELKQLVAVGKKEAKEDSEDSDIPTAPIPKCGYTITVQLAPGIAIGPFREELKFVTDARDGITETVYVDGRRPGPLQIMGTGGVYWYGEQMILRLGRFAASKGKTGTFSLFIDDVPGGVTLDVVEVRPKALKFQIEKDPKFVGQKRVRFLARIEVPAGAEPIACSDGEYGEILLQTNHPQANSIPIKLEFVSY